MVIHFLGSLLLYICFYARRYSSSRVQKRKVTYFGEFFRTVQFCFQASPKFMNALSSLSSIAVTKVLLISYLFCIKKRIACAYRLSFYAFGYDVLNGCAVSKVAIVVIYCLLPIKRWWIVTNLRTMISSVSQGQSLCKQALSSYFIRPRMVLLPIEKERSRDHCKEDEVEIA